MAGIYDFAARSNAPGRRWLVGGEVVVVVDVVVVVVVIVVVDVVVVIVFPFHC